MRSLMSFSDDCKETGVDVIDADYDSFYDTVDVCSWDKHSKEGRLSRRIIQILEYRGVDVDFFRKCADDGTKWLCRLHEDSNSLLEYISKRHMEMTKRHSNNNSDIFHDNILFRMASAKMDINEPIYAQKILQL
eukprot:14787292-Ditylum_brightwellii.AAC.1